VPERLSEPHVPDPCHEPLVHERLADEPRLVGSAEPGDDLVGARARREEIWPEATRDTVSQREHRTVPLCRLPFASAQDEPRGAPPPDVGTPADTPAAVHAQVAPDDYVTLEAQEQVLPDSVHGLEQAAVDGRRHTGHSAARIRALGLQALAHEDVEPAGDAME